MYKALTNELEKIAIKFNSPKLQLFKAKVSAHAVKVKPAQGRVVRPKPADMSAQPQVVMHHAGELGRMVQPPPVRF